MTKQQPLKILALSIIIVSLIIIAWGFNKAFDFTDAGYYLLRYQDKQPLEYGGHMYEHVLVRAVFPANLRTVIPLRIIGLVLNLLSSLLFAFSLSKMLKKWAKGKNSFSFVFFLVFAGFVFSYSGSPSELSYNSLNQFFLISGASLLILALQSEPKHKLWFTSAAGATLSFCMLSKLPTGLVVAVLATALLLLSRDRRRLAILVFCLSWAGVLGIVAVTIKPNFISYYANFYLDLNKYIIYDSSLLKKSIIDIAKLNILVICQALAVNILLWWAQKTPKPVLQVTLRLAALGSVLYFITERIVDHLQGDMLLSDFLMYFVYLAIFYIAISGRKVSVAAIKGWLAYLKEHLLSCAIVVFILILPYLGALGTSNPLNWGAKYYYAAIMGALALTALLSEIPRIKTLSIVIALYMIAMGMFHYVQYPYHSKPLYTQNIEYKGIKYDYQKWVFLQQTETILKRYGFSPEQGIITAYKCPGLVYLNDSFQPGSVLWSQETEDLYFAILSRNYITAKPVLLSIGKEPSDSFISKLNTAMKIDFSSDYKLMASYPYYDENSKVYVYFPSQP
ncbi:MAG: hypothetical protein PHY48_04605 [Candidatus Cloacimonetes bacterium]|nr:hypothetical protein [Candidatus Cloacimonadota bacterium]